MSLTSAQQEAIVARGNVLVIAGAGTGKTRTLVERCLSCLVTEKPPVSIDEILMVTFTEAAAAEMRLRIRQALEKESAKDARNLRWREQLALFETAHIGTLHSFCLQLVRQHFYELELDPQLSVLPEEEARLLAEETLETLLRDHYAGRAANAEAVQQLIQTHSHGSDKPIRALVLRLHHYTQTLPNPADWLREQLALFASPEPVQWRDWLRAALAEWPSRWLPSIAQLEAQNGVAANCAAVLRSWPAGFTPADAAPLLERLESAIQNCPAGKVTAWVKPLKEFRSEAEFLSSLVSQAGPGEPLAEDWAWIRSDMTALLRLAQEFGHSYSEAKRELGGVDFHDLEQHALRLLWDAEQNQPTKIAAQWRQKLRFVFVDEYQDINAAQDKIIEAISRGGAQANRFLVGDVKQSIYRFRLANPSIFRGYAEKWRDAQGRALPLAENFRSREGVLDFINSLFELIMRRQMGGVEYDEQARLRFGAPAQRQALSVAAAPAPRVELHFRVKGHNDPQEMDDESAEAMTLVGELEEAEKEARLVALRLKELKAEDHLIWDDTAGQFRQAQWSDMAVLLRSPSNKSESYAKEFARCNIPLIVARGGFYKSTEVSDLLSLLQLLDNPLQDLPALAVLHSPLVGLNLNELADIRLARLKVRFWTALREWAEGEGQRAEDGGQRTENRQQATDDRERRTENTGAPEKVSAFLERFGRWRRLARQASLSRCLEAVLQETHYAAWLLTQPRGEQRHANVQRLLGLAQQFDQFQRHGLFRFLRFIEAQQIAEIEPEVPSVCEENSVRLMSIHQSKGLEFPVVVLADLGKAFNISDLRADIILDEQYGLCPQVKPPHTGKRYPSLPFWLARQRQQREMLGEELRLLYVAMTRARDTLVLTGNISEAKFKRLWEAEPDITPAALEAARSFSDWLGCWFARNFAGTPADQGENELLRWTIHSDTRLIPPAAGLTPEPELTGSLSAAAPGLCASLRQRLEWSYPFAAATRKPAKASVTALRRLAAEQSEEEAARLFADEPTPHAGAQIHDSAPRRWTAGSKAKLTGTELGAAHHTFLQLVSLERTGSAAELEQEAQRLLKAGALTVPMVGALNFQRLAAFWRSPLGRKTREQRQFVHRELEFTARFSPIELATLTGIPVEPTLENEFIVVQGVADLAVILPDELWLLDFKSDLVSPSELAEKVKRYEPQLKLYAHALEQIYRRPVSAAWLYFLACDSAVRVALQ